MGVLGPLVMVWKIMRLPGTGESHGASHGRWLTPAGCKASVGTGQCMTVAEEGSDYCRVHAGSYQPPEKGLRQYLLARAQDRARLAAFAEHDDIKSLRDEIALTRMMIEGLWNSAQSDVERLAVYGRVNSHILTLERLVKTCNQIEERLGTSAGETDALACRPADMPEAREPTRRRAQLRAARGHVDPRRDNHDPRGPQRCGHRSRPSGPS